MNIYGVIKKHFYKGIHLGAQQENYKLVELLCGSCVSNNAPRNLKGKAMTHLQSPLYFIPFTRIIYIYVRSLMADA